MALRTCLPLLILLLFLPFFLSFSAVTGSEANCTCTEQEAGGADKRKALELKYQAIGLIFIFSAVGILCPILGKSLPSLYPDTEAFFLMKAFAAGVILATGMVHIFPDAFERLTSPCLPESPWGKFSFAGFVAMMSALLTLMVDVSATAYCISNADKAPEQNDQEMVSVPRTDEEQLQHQTASQYHTNRGGGMPQEQIRQRVVSQVLELGIVVHSVIIGISMGASLYPSTVRPLIWALCFHQFFEGIGLGSCMTQAEFKARVTAIMALFFSLTTPVGIAVGIAIASRYDENSKVALIVEGLLDSASAGILVYMALVDLLAVDFINRRMNVKLQLKAYTALLLGAGFMSVIAKWA